MRLMSYFILEAVVAMVTDSDLLQVHYNEFIPQFEKQYPEFPWSGVQVSLGLCQFGAVEAIPFLYKQRGPLPTETGRYGWAKTILSHALSGPVCQFWRLFRIFLRGREEIRSIPRKPKSYRLQQLQESNPIGARSRGIGLKTGSVQM